MLRLTTYTPVEVLSELFHTGLGLDELILRRLGLGVPPSLIRPSAEALFPDDGNQIPGVEVYQTATAKPQ